MWIVSLLLLTLLPPLSLAKSPGHNPPEILNLYEASQLLNISLREAVDLAYEGHRDQVDKSEEPYIKHLMRVTSTLPTEYMSVAILHDYFEDVAKIHELHEIELYLPFLDEAEIFALYLLTRPPHLSYSGYIDRIAESDSAIAKEVKRMDLVDHLVWDLVGGGDLPESLAKRYSDALEVIDPSDSYV